MTKFPRPESPLHFDHMHDKLDDYFFSYLELILFDVVCRIRFFNVKPAVKRQPGYRGRTRRAGNFMHKNQNNKDSSTCQIYERKMSQNTSACTPEYVLKRIYVVRGDCGHFRICRLFAINQPKT